MSIEIAYLNVFFVVMDMMLSLNWLVLGTLRVLFHFDDNWSYYIDEDAINDKTESTTFQQDTYCMDNHCLPYIFRPFAKHSRIEFGQSLCSIVVRHPGVFME